MGDRRIAENPIDKLAWFQILVCLPKQLVLKWSQTNIAR